MSATTKANLDAAKKQTADVEKEFAKNQPKIQEVLKSLQAAISKSDGAMLELYAGRIDSTSALISDTLRDCTGAASSIAELRKDADFLEANFAAIKTLTGKVDVVKKALSEQLLLIKKLAGESSASREKLEGGKTEAVEKYADLEDRLNDRKKVMERKAKEIEIQTAAADKAIAAKNQAALTAARTKIIELDYIQDTTLLGALEKDIAAFTAKFKNSELRTEATWLQDEILKLRDLPKDREKQIARLMKVGQINAAAAPSGAAPSKPKALSNDEVGKAGKLLGVPAADLPRLARVLNGQPHMKWADELTKLAKELKWKATDGKAMVSKLNNLDFVKKLYLIDI